MFKTEIVNISDMPAMFIVATTYHAETVATKQQVNSIFKTELQNTFEVHEPRTLLIIHNSFDRMRFFL